MPAASRSVVTVTAPRPTSQVPLGASRSLRMASKGRHLKVQEVCLAAAIWVAGCVWWGIEGGVWALYCRQQLHCLWLSQLEVGHFGGLWVIMKTAVPPLWLWRAVVDGPSHLPAPEQIALALH